MVLKKKEFMSLNFIQTLQELLYFVQIDAEYFFKIMIRLEKSWDKFFIPIKMKLVQLSSKMRSMLCLKYSHIYDMIW